MTCVAPGQQLLIVTPSYFPNMDAEAIVNTKLGRALEESGFSLDIVSKRAVRPEARDQQGRLVLYEYRFPRSRKLLKSLTGPYWAGTLRHFRELQWARAVASKAVRRIAQKDYFALLSFGGYCHMAALRVAKSVKLPWLAVWNDPFPSLIAPPPYGSGLDTPLPFYLRTVFADVGRLASCHIFPSERLRRYMLNLLPPEAAGNSYVIPHIGRIGQAQPRAAHRNGPLITHVGGLLPHRRPDVFFKGLAMYARKANVPPLAVRFVGSGVDRIAEIAKAHGQDHRCEFIAEQPYHVALELLQDSDILLAIEAHNTESIFLPSKLADYAVSGRPILAITPRQSEIRDLLSRNGGGVCAATDSAEEVCEALSTLCLNWKEGTLTARYASPTLSCLFSQQQVVERYLQMVGWQSTTVGGPAPMTSSRRTRSE